MEHYGKKVRFFVYDSNHLAEIDHFAQSSDINVMIINTQAFNSGFNVKKVRQVTAAMLPQELSFPSGMSSAAVVPLM